MKILIGQEIPMKAFLDHFFSIPSLKEKNHKNAKLTLE